MATLYREACIVEKTMHEFQVGRKQRRKDFEAAEDRAEEMLLAEAKRTYAGQTLYAVFLDPLDERFLRGVFLTYDEALDHIRDDEKRYFYEKDQPALVKLVKAARSKIPTPSHATLIKPSGHTPYGIEAVDATFLADRLKWKLEEPKRSREQSKRLNRNIWD